MKKQSLALHSSYTKDSNRTMAVPIYMSTAYEFKSTEHAAESFNLKHGAANIYTRLGNPTTDIFEKRFAELEGGSAALATASGMSAIFYSVANFAEAGDNIIASSKLYGGTVTLFSFTLKRFGIEARFFDPAKPEEIEKLVDEKTKLIFFETITNPSIDVPDFEGIVSVARKHRIATVVDNTVASPVLCNPLGIGCDIVVHSTSKYTTGQGLGIGGIMVERRDIVGLLKDNPRYRHFNEPDQSYHGLVYTDNFPECPYILRARLSLMRDTGAAPSPFNAWIFIQGLETLAIRMKTHSENALAVAEFLKNHPRVLKVNYPGLPGDKNYPLARKYFKNGCSGLISFELPGFDEAKKTVDRTRLFSLVTNIGDSKSIITHPASTTHQQLSSEELKAAGVPEGLIRLSVGLEDKDDLIADLKQALDGI